MRLKFGFLLVICALLGDTLAVGREEQEARIVENKFAVVVITAPKYRSRLS